MVDASTVVKCHLEGEEYTEQALAVLIDYQFALVCPEHGGGSSRSLPLFGPYPAF